MRATILCPSERFYRSKDFISQAAVKDMLGK
jgi:hypothetical protein